MALLRLVHHINWDAKGQAVARIRFAVQAIAQLGATTTPRTMQARASSYLPDIAQALTPTVSECRAQGR